MNKCDATPGSKIGLLSGDGGDAEPGTGIVSKRSVANAVFEADICPSGGHNSQVSSELIENPLPLPKVEILWDWGGAYSKAA